MRFLNSDPAMDGLNWYAYAGGNPINFADPTGFMAARALDAINSGINALGMAGSNIIGAIQSAANSYNAFVANNRAQFPEMAKVADFLEKGLSTPGVGTGLGVVATPKMAVSVVTAARVEAAVVNTIDSAAVRFSQSSISRNFSAGGTIDDLAAGLRSGSVNPNSLPPIRLVEREGSMFTLDNRRLWSFQQAEVPIPYRMATPQEAAAEAWKFTTPNGGASIRVRGQ
jgi:hypothetical protein